MATQGTPSLLKRWIVAILRILPRTVFGTTNRLVAAVTEDRPVHRVERFEWAKDVEAMFPEVRREMEHMLRHIEAIPTVHDIIPTTEYIFTRRNWRQVPFYLYGVPIPEYCELYPKTWETFRKVKDLTGGSVSILAPGEGVPMHDHNYKGFLIFQLGVIVPKDGGGCGMRIGDEAITWDEGEVVVIDPTYNHETWNNTEHYRVLLLGEFRRPDLPRVLKFIDFFVIWTFMASPIGRRLVRHVQGFAARYQELVALRPDAVAR